MLTRLGGRRRLAQEANDEGLTLIETIVAITLFALIAAATGSMILTGVGVSRDARNRTAAAGVAGEQLEVARAKSISSFTSLASGGTTTTTKTVNNVLYTTVQTVNFIPKNSPTGACDNTVQGGNTAVQPVLLVTESTTWPHMSGVTPVTTQTTVKPPVGTYSTTSGGIDVKVIDHANAPVSNVTLTATSGATTVTATSNAQGCAYFAYMAAATYTVQASAPNYVDNQELTTSSATASVVAGQVVTTTFFYDKAAEVDVTWSPSTLTPATNMPVTVGNSGLSPTATYTLANGVVALKPLYPYSSYGVWAGRCPEASPTAVNSSNSFLYSPQTTAAASPIAGQAVGVTVPLNKLTVAVKDSTTNLAANGATLSITEVAGVAKNACTGFQTYGLVTSQTVGGVVGQSITGVPLGSFTLTATIGSRTVTKSIVVPPAGLTTSVTV